MTEPEAEYGERMRRALHAAADSVVPSGDGLERIRSRIAHEPSREGLGLLLGWLRSVTADVRASPPSLRPVIAALKSSLVPVVKSGLPTVTAIVVALKSAVQRPRAGGGWLRPALAAAGAALVAAAAILGSPALRHTVAAQISSLLQHTNPKPPANHPAINLGPGTPGPSPAIPLPSPSPSPSSAKAPPRPIQPTPLPTTCAPLTGQASPAATPAAAPRQARTTCQTQAPGPHQHHPRHRHHRRHPRPRRPRSRRHRQARRPHRALPKRRRPERPSEPVAAGPSYRRSRHHRSVRPGTAAPAVRGRNVGEPSLGRTEPSLVGTARRGKPGALRPGEVHGQRTGACPCSRLVTVCEGGRGSGGAKGTAAADPEPSSQRGRWGAQDRVPASRRERDGRACA